MNDSNRLLGIITLCAAGFVLLLCRSIEEIPDTHTLSATFFPQLLAVVLLIFGAALTFQGRGSTLTATVKRVTQPKNMCLVVLTLLYTCFFSIGDYRINTFVYLVAAIWALGYRKRTGLILVPIITTALMYAIFRHGFTVLLPVMG